MIQVHSCNLLCSSIVMTDGLFERVSVFVMIPCFLKKWCISFCLLTVLLVFFSSLLPFSKLAELQHHLLSHLLANMIQVFLHSWALCTTVALVVYISPSAKYLCTYQVSLLWLCKRFLSHPEHFHFQLCILWLQTDQMGYEFQNSIQGFDLFEESKTFYSNGNLLLLPKV